MLSKRAKINAVSPDIVLASASPRRAELLKQLGWQPEVLPVDIDERIKAGEAAKDYCLRMANEKSLSAQQNVNHTALELASLPVLTADTIVVLDGIILGKPKNPDDAILTLVKLSGRKHQVYSAVSVWFGGQQQTKISANEVTMSAISEQQIQAYVNSGEPMDKAGSYGIQGYAAMWISNINGSYSSVMGLPLFETTEILKELGIMMPLELLNKS